MADSSKSNGSPNQTHPLALMWSGGKDATLALDVLVSDDTYHVEVLVTTVEEGTETVTMHGTPLALIRAQAEALQVPLAVMRVPPGASNAVYEDRLGRTLAPLQSRGIETVAVADVFLEDIREYRESVFRTIGVDVVFPIWGEKTSTLAKRFWELGYRAVVTSADTAQIDGSFPGRSFDPSFVNDLPDAADPCGENGEFHTFVTGGPLFRADVPVEVGEKYGEGRMRYVDLTHATKQEADRERGEG